MLVVAFWFLVIAIAYTYIGYPLLIMGLSLFFRTKTHKQTILPSVTFLITAYNEQASIRQKLTNALSLDYPRDLLEIIVASDASNDQTDAIVKEFADQGVKLFRVEGRLGKTITQNKAVETATGEIIIFSDATTSYNKNAIKHIVANYADPTVGGVSGRVVYTNEADSHIGHGIIRMWDYENLIKLHQSKLYTLTGACGCIYSARKVLYKPLPAHITGDLVVPLQVLAQGYRIVFEPEAVGSEASLSHGKQEFAMRIRVVSMGLTGLIYMKNLLNPIKHPYLAFQLISHKFCRWLVPIFAGGLYFINLFLLNKDIVYQISFILQSLFYCTAILGWLLERHNKKIKLVSLAYYFSILNLAAVVAIIQTLAGRKDVTWQTIR